MPQATLAPVGTKVVIRVLSHNHVTFDGSDGRQQGTSVLDGVLTWDRTFFFFQPQDGPQSQVRKQSGTFFLNDEGKFVLEHTAN